MQTSVPVVVALLWLVGGAAQAQNLVRWVEPDQRRIAVVGDTAAQRQVRFSSGWEIADYAAFARGELTGEMVYLTARDGAAIDFPLTASDIPRLFRIGEEGAITFGKSGRGRALLGSAFGQRFTVAGLGQQCFSFQSSDVARSGSAPGLSDRAIYGYACSPAEESRAQIEDFLRAIRLVGPGFVEEEAMMASAEADGARDFALGQDDQGPVPRGLAEMPLGYAVPDPVGGG
ncbi:MAG: hypothetical protein AB7I59_31170 [Geminicoccaceae bacterium]